MSNPLKHNHVEGLGYWCPSPDTVAGAGSPGAWEKREDLAVFWGHSQGSSLLPFILKKLWRWVARWRSLVNPSPSSERLSLLTQPLLCLIMTLGTSNSTWNWGPHLRNIPCIAGCLGQENQIRNLKGTSQQLVLQITKELLLARQLWKVSESQPAPKHMLFTFMLHHLHSPKEHLSQSWVVYTRYWKQATMLFEGSWSTNSY